MANCFVVSPNDIGTQCALTGYSIRKNSIVVRLTDENIENFHQIILDLLPNIKIPLVAARIIVSFVSQPTTGQLVLQNYIIQEKKSRSGRKIKACLRLVNQEYVSGSGAYGCDQFDRGYDRGEFQDREKLLHDYDLHRPQDSVYTSCTIVDDDEEVVYESSISSEEEEEASEDYSTEESDGDFSEYDD